MATFTIGLFHLMRIKFIATKIKDGHWEVTVKALN